MFPQSPTPAIEPTQPKSMLAKSLLLLWFWDAVGFQRRDERK